MTDTLSNKILRLSEAEKFNVELFKTIALDLWTTMLAGEALIDLKDKADDEMNTTSDTFNWEDRTLKLLLICFRKSQ